VSQVGHPREAAAAAASLYDRLGYPLREAPGQYFLDQRRADATIHKDEIWSLQRLLEPSRDGASVVVGAAFGLWSVVVAILLPRVRIVAIDLAGPDADAASARAHCRALSG
jgi:hypothetical protein